MLPTTPRPTDSPGNLVSAIGTVVAVILALPGFAAIVEGSSKAPRWAVIVSYISLFAFVPIALLYWAFRIGAYRANKLHDEKHEESALDKLSRAIHPAADPDKPVNPKEVKKKLASLKADSAKLKQWKTFQTDNGLDADPDAAIQALTEARDDSVLVTAALCKALDVTTIDPKGADAAVDAARQKHERNVEAKVLAEGLRLEREHKNADDAIRKAFDTATGLGTDLVAAADVLTVERSKLATFLTTTKLDVDLTKAASALAAERSAASESSQKLSDTIANLQRVVEEQRAAHTAATQTATLNCDKRIDETLRQAAENEKKRELKDYAAVRLFVLAKHGHGVTHNGLPFPSRKVTLSLGLMVTNYGRRGFWLRELRDIAVGVNWDSEIKDCEAVVPVGNRVIPGDQYIDVGCTDAPFYEFDSKNPIDIPTGDPPPMLWSQFGTAVVKGSLWVAVGNTPDDPSPVPMHLDFQEFIAVPLTLNLLPHARIAVNSIMRALPGRDVDSDTANKLVQSALASLDKDRK